MRGTDADRRHPGLEVGPIYLDYNSTTPADPRVVDAMLPYLRVHFGNPSNTHYYAEEPRRALTHARDQLLKLIGADGGQIVFTGSGSEADALAVRGTALADPTTRVHIITEETEHAAVLEMYHSLQRLHGVDVTFLPVDGFGRVHPEDLADALTDRTALVSIMYANNETGTIQSIAQLAEIAHAHGALFHTDAAQAPGKIRIDVRGLGVDLVTLVGHKMYAPKGVGALWVRSGVRLEPVMYGGGQEHGLRSGTENVPLAVAFGTAADLAVADLANGEPDRVRELRDELHQALTERLPGRIALNGHPTERLPNTANLSILGVPGRQLLTAIPAIAAATGSACHAGNTAPSSVVAAMARGNQDGSDADGRARSAVRFSLGRWTTREQITHAAKLLAEAAS